MQKESYFSKSSVNVGIFNFLQTFPLDDLEKLFFYLIFNSFIDPKEGDIFLFYIIFAFFD